MITIRCAVLLFATLWLAACGGGGGGGGSPAPPPAPPPAAQTHAATITAVETVRAADQLALPVAGLPSTGGSITVSN